ncbi:NADH-quinone oxidoreductase subunit L [Bacillus sp. CGMCC 1.16541]|uniref:NADH-quinone oxidoreductase subunit L n=1 Tax=Bacillus sp. CGMCC 1.16541 TaxID=2185143 RepID=UPI000D7255F3|nr:NADH-quinone oxidoreductase subunit L [Bacillus sp. CGMCC 1.16541]
MMANAWLIPLFPLVSFILLLVIGRKLKEKSAYVGILFTFVSVVFSALVVVDRFYMPTLKQEGTWFTIGDVLVQFGFEVTPLNALMLIIVSVVSLLVHIYANAYMKGEERLSTFYAYLGLFTFAMLGLVLSPNLLQLYLFWELVGLGSFLLIGFYFQKEEAKAAAKKAFIMTRIGDIGLFIGIILLFWEVGSFNYEDIFTALNGETLSPTMITLTSILIFIGAIGKSGQWPLHSWLPDAMEGPTPVSALIHAATMVAAGVYLVATMFPLFLESKLSLTIVATVGGLTALFAASIALVQTDIKRILAYSTISQLGYMMLALGSAGYVAGVFHLMTHAFFKALLFLAAGSVIHSIHVQHVEKLGGLWKPMKVTALFFLIGTLAISGVPLFSGFFSKEEILIATWNDGRYVLFILALLTAFLTAFYMFRLFFLVFAGKSQAPIPKQSATSLYMTVPMGVLGFLAIFSGYVHTHWFGTFLGDWLISDRPSLQTSHAEGPLWIMVVTVMLSLLGIGLAYIVYKREVISRSWLSNSFPTTTKVLVHGYYVDELYKATIVKGVLLISLLFNYIETFLVKGVLNSIVSTVVTLSKLGSHSQNGQVQRYGFVAFIGLALLMLLFVLKGGV